MRAFRGSNARSARETCSIRRSRTELFDIATSSSFHRPSAARPQGDSRGTTRGSRLARISSFLDSGQPILETAYRHRFLTPAAIKKNDFLIIHSELVMFSDASQHFRLSYRRIPGN